jgi:hypothetical protein
VADTVLAAVLAAVPTPFTAGDLDVAAARRRATASQITELVRTLTRAGNG